MCRIYDGLLGLTILAMCCGNALGFEGFLEPSKTVDIASAETGVLSKISVKEGDEVKKGDVLAILDYRLVEASLRVAKARKNASASIQAAQAELKMAKRKLAQFEKLHAAGNARRDEVEVARLEENVARSQVSRAKEQQAIAALEYKRIQTEIETNHIRSPIDGVVTTINRDTGELVSSSQGPFIRIVNTEQLQFISNLPADKPLDIMEGSEVKIALDGQSEALVARVEYFSDIIDPTSGTAKITLVVEQPGTAKSGMAGRILLD
ncbi:MAG: efflux RND transporter periplasmic adaptor subunit [Acidiferrobacterales bacterium]|nr:efflux RND transporter periplasmic adaptor subunit [Acidiferrobacterales bacterium]